MKILFLIFFWISVNYEIYNMFRKKYEVFGIIIDNNKGAMAIGNRYFRTYKRAVKYYEFCKNNFMLAHMTEI